jgi:hypothetical protein
MIIWSTFVENLLTVVTDKRSIAELSLLDDKFEASGIPGKVFYFHRIKTLSQYEGIGEGRDLIIEVCKFMDKENATIYNILNPYGKRDLKSLIKFFEASGFEMFQDPNVMIRTPKDSSKEQPYIIKHKKIQIRSYNKNYGDEKICQCGHPYHRHFDSYDKMRACGCKYCECYIFIEKRRKNNNEDTNEHTL